MSLHGQIIQGLKSVIAPLAGEDVTINGVTVKAIINETESKVELGAGAMKRERSLTIQFQSGQIALDPKGANKILARGEDWQISSEPGSIRIGMAATTLVLVEPNRRASEY